MAVRIYLDTNVFIEAIEGRGALRDALVSLLTVETEVRHPLVTSALTLSELLVKPYELGRDDLIRVYENATVTNEIIEVIPIVRDVLRDAARLRSRDKSLKLPDAIYLTTARGTHCSHFLTNDRGLRSRTTLEVMRLTEENVQNLLERLSRDAL
jgi:predicted nucleic acid-binding protein